MATTGSGHLPVMTDRVLALLAPALQPEGAVLVDATLGRAGHASALLSQHPGLTLIGVDADDAAIEESRAAARAYGGRVTLVHARYDEIGEILAGLGQPSVQGVLFDLGVSSPQLDDPGRGFAYSYDAPLDMRMDQTGPLTAAEVVNTYPAARLARVLREYGEERFARRIADAVVRERSRDPADLDHAAGRDRPRLDPGPGPADRRQPGQAHLPGAADRGQRRAGRAAPGAARGPGRAWRCGGRIVVLAYHSLEDRAVKRALAAGAGGHDAAGPAGSARGRRPRFRLLTRGAERPDGGGSGGQPAGRLGPAAGRRANTGSRMSNGRSTSDAKTTGRRAPGEHGRRQRTRRAAGRRTRPGCRRGADEYHASARARSPAVRRSRRPAGRPPGRRRPPQGARPRARPAGRPGPRPPDRAPGPPGRQARDRPARGPDRPPRPARPGARPAAAARRGRARRRRPVSRTPFILLVLGLLGGGLVCLLVINTTLAAASFRINALQQSNAQAVPAGAGTAAAGGDRGVAGARSRSGRSGSACGCSRCSTSSTCGTAAATPRPATVTGAVRGHPGTPRDPGRRRGSRRPERPGRGRGPAARAARPDRAAGRAAGGRAADPSGGPASRHARAGAADGRQPAAGAGRSAGRAAAVPVRGGRRRRRGRGRDGPGRRPAGGPARGRPAGPAAAPGWPRPARPAPGRPGRRLTHLAAVHRAGAGRCSRAGWCSCRACTGRSTGRWPQQQMLPPQPIPIPVAARLDHQQRRHGAGDDRADRPGLRRPGADHRRPSGAQVAAALAGPLGMTQPADPGAARPPDARPSTWCSSRTSRPATGARIMALEAAGHRRGPDLLPGLPQRRSGRQPGRLHQRRHHGRPDRRRPGWSRSTTRCWPAGTAARRSSWARPSSPSRRPSRSSSRRCRPAACG